LLCSTLALAPLALQFTDGIFNLRIGQVANVGGESAGENTGTLSKRLVRHGVDCISP
jgi:hypothetical protein